MCWIPPWCIGVCCSVKRYETFLQFGSYRSCTQVHDIFQSWHGVTSAISMKRTRLFPVHISTQLLPELWVGTTRVGLSRTSERKKARFGPSHCRVNGLDCCMRGSIFLTPLDVPWDPCDVPKDILPDFHEHAKE